jgi:hypothetical protein
VTIFGPDISSFQNGLDLGHLGAASFVIAKTTEGTYYTDDDYQGWRRQAAGLGLPFVWYHFLSGQDAHAQVAHTLANVGDASLPGMLDVEPEGSFSPTLAQAIAYIDAAHGAGLNLKLIYLPRWYWQQLGSPDLSPLATRGLSLVASSYPGGTGSPGQLYPGDSAPGWQAYDGMTPLLYQYTNQASDGGKPLDYNAFRGSQPQLLAYLGASSPAPSTTSSSSSGDPMGTIPPSISQKWPELAGDFPPNATFTDESALIWADGGARAAALYAQQARDAINALAAKIIVPPPPPAIDVNALAQALAPVLQTGPSADQVATAVVAHLATTLGRG